MFPGLCPGIAVDREARQPLHSQIYNAYREAILNGNFLSGQQVPSSRSLAAELGISRIPVLEAYAQLIAEGYFEARAGSGTYVSSSLPQQNGARAENKSSSGRARARNVAGHIAGLPGRGSQRWLSGSGAFSVGQLGFDHFPFRAWVRILTRHCRKVHANSMNYGDPMGSREFRETIAAYVRTARAVRCDARQIMVVNGSQNALDICARVLVDPGSPVWVEDPGYMLLHSTLVLAGCRLVPVTVDDEGMNIAAGMRACRKAKAAWVTPSHQYPLGVTMSASRRLELLEWADAAGGWIVEDDYDSEYRYDSMPIASLQGLDDKSRVVYIGTFSKTLFPSLRLGYMVLPIDLVDQFTAVRRAIDVCPPLLYQAVLTDFIREGYYARHLRKMRLLYAERRKALVQSIEREFGSRVEISGDAAGMHLAILVPDAWNDQQIAQRAAQQKLWIWPLSPAYLGKKRRQGFVLGFGSTDIRDIPEAVHRIRCLVA